MIIKDQASHRKTTLVLALVLAVCQIGLVPSLGILGGRANLALVFVACTCMGGSVQMAPLLGFGAGLVYDLAGTGPIGLMTLILTIIGWMLAHADRVSVADDRVGALMLFIPLAVACEVLYAFVLIAAGMTPSPFEALVMRALPGAVLDGVSMWIVTLVLAHAGGNTSRGLSLEPQHKGRTLGSSRLKRGL